jgi:hypothetical protein
LGVVATFDDQTTRECESRPFGYSSWLWYVMSNNDQVACANCCRRFPNKHPCNVWEKRGAIYLPSVSDRSSWFSDGFDHLFLYHFRVITSRSSSSRKSIPEVVGQAVRFFDY